MRIMALGALILNLAIAGTARAQTFSDLVVQLGGYSLSIDGGEKAKGVWLSTGPVVIGRATTGTFSVGGCAAFAVSSDGSFREDATTAWRVEVTPLRVIRHAVTVRLRWVRPLDPSKAMTIPTHDVELTLRPGESWPIDSVPVPPGLKDFNGRPCRATAASVRISVDHHPSEGLDRRLIEADLWLIERLPDGSERSQALSVRGVPNRPFPFYFDTIVDGKLPLDIFGELVARPESEALEVSIETRSRWGEPSDWGRVLGPGQLVKSAIRVNPKEIVEVRLPRISEGSGRFANREFAIRIRARQVR